MTKHRDPCLETGCLFDPGAERIAHALLGELNVTEGVPLLGRGCHRHRRLERPHLHALCDNDDAEILAFTAAVMQVLDDRLELGGKLRDDDHVGAAGQPSHHCDPSGIATHHLDNHDAMMGGGRGVQPIERLDHHADRGIESDAELGDGEVVVDRLRDADHRIVGLAHGRRDGQRIVAADRHQAVDAAAAQQPDDLLDATFLLEGVGAGRAKDGPPERQDATHRGRCQVLHVARSQQPGPAVLDAGDLESLLEGAAGDPPDGRVEPGRVATAGENADSHDA